MPDADAFDLYSLVAERDADPAEVLAEAGRLIAAAAEAGTATLIELDGAYQVGWHPLLGAFRVARRSPGAPEHLPAWLASLEDARHVHAGGDRPDEAVADLLALVRETSERL
jgi:hypothetical protein